MNGMSKFIIGEVLDNNTQERSKEFGYRVGRTCYMYDEYVGVGLPLVVAYDENRYFRTSTIVAVDQTDYGVWVTTKNRTYRFDSFSTAHKLQEV